MQLRTETTYLTDDGVEVEITTIVKKGGAYPCIGYKWAPSKTLLIDKAEIIVGNWSLDGMCKQGRKGNLVREKVQETPFDVAVNLIAEGRVEEGKALLAKHMGTETLKPMVSIDSTGGWE